MFTMNWLLFFQFRSQRWTLTLFWLQFSIGLKFAHSVLKCSDQDIGQSYLLNIPLPVNLPATGESLDDLIVYIFQVWVEQEVNQA